MDKKQHTPLYYNSVSYFGFLVMLVSILLIIFLLLANLSLKQPSPYIGIATYLIMPIFVVIGLLLFLWGMRRESLRRRKDGKEAPAYPRLDLNDRKQRRWFGIVLVGGSLVGVLLLFVGYNAFLFTESVTFCGQVCHTVMQPEYTAYLNGPHARVPCVECHVGRGVSWYVKSKLSGVRQVFAVTFDTYQRPIPTPIENLRPARETCEECHWPAKFYGAQLIQNPHFRYDKDNTPEQISLLVRTGGGARQLGEMAGIHWHMIIDNEVHFRATDRGLQHIPWVKVIHHDGTQTIYEDDRTKLSEKQIDALPSHKMDCMDCHNRPSHIFNPPEKAVDLAMQSNEISPSIPWIKKVAVDALVAPYTDKNAAHTGIHDAIVGYYQKNKDLDANMDAVDHAVGVVESIWDRSVFPDMNVNWKSYPMNIGHRDWPGCFRCHDGHHKTKDGKVLTQSCTTCHTMPQRGPLTPLGSTAPASTENWHPWKLEGKHAKILCSRCHAAGFRPSLDCLTCHGFKKDAPMMDMGCDSCHTKPQYVKPLEDCTSCHTVTGLHKEGGHPDAECTTCHKPHTWKVTSRDTCYQCHENKKDHHPGEFCGDCHKFTAE